MPQKNYFEELLDFFSEKLQSLPPEEERKNQEIELYVDGLYVLIQPGNREGSLHLSIPLGLILQPLREEKLEELVKSNFLGANTGGCTLAFDEKVVALSLHCHTSWGTSAQENWEWLHRILSMAREWNTILAKWEEFVPLSGLNQEKKDEYPTLQSSYRI